MTTGVAAEDYKSSIKKAFLFFHRALHIHVVGYGILLKNRI